MALLPTFVIHCDFKGKNTTRFRVTGLKTNTNHENVVVVVGVVFVDDDVVVVVLVV